ncbi:uncharacterized protein [Amphiura filiformis]|uniref:uncharacterized protein n=1 Tax=Amphiura filiformis TaxID=82378 RepID=UPI003B22781B
MASLETHQDHESTTTKTDQQINSVTNTKPEYHIKDKEETAIDVETRTENAVQTPAASTNRDGTANKLNATLSMQIQCINTTNDWDTSDLIGSVGYKSNQDKIILVRPKTVEERSKDKRTLVLTVLVAVIPVVILLLVALPMILHESATEIHYHRPVQSTTLPSAAGL